jgi:hypothetical protein
MRADLPDEAEEALDFDGLLAVLDSLVGDEVCADVDIGDARLDSRFAASGSLRRIVGPGGLPTFAVGDLFVLVLDRADFREARLRTYDGHGFYAVSMAFGAARLTLADVGSAGMDYQGY